MHAILEFMILYPRPSVTAPGISVLECPFQDVESKPPSSSKIVPSCPIPCVQRHPCRVRYCCHQVPSHERLSRHLSFCKDRIFFKACLPRWRREFEHQRAAHNWDLVSQIKTLAVPVQIDGLWGSHTLPCVDYRLTSYILPSLCTFPGSPHWILPLTGFSRVFPRWSRVSIFEGRALSEWAEQMYLSPAISSRTGVRYTVLVFVYPTIPQASLKC